jgi:hypothetical protein
MQEIPVVIERSLCARLFHPGAAIDFSKAVITPRLAGAEMRSAGMPKRRAFAVGFGND